MSDMFTDASPLSCNLEHLEEFYSKKKEISSLHIETSNGRNCRTCNKANVCKYQETVVENVEKTISTLEKKELPLSVNINCREWSGKDSGVLR